jgi:methylated-DNA-[protein]-cysteine S-methyltransferase
MSLETTSFDGYLSAPFGAVGVKMRGVQVARIGFLSEMPAATAGDNPALASVLDQLRSYLEDPQHDFDIPIFWQGTAFQQRVWRALQGIPIGTTCSYGEIAYRLGSSARAVGGACRANNTVLVVPCHRVVSANGLGGFSGETEGAMPNIKRWLLAHEGATARG